ncbi:hypothetical protein F2Q69_00034938 [Brassica cretica]|uniref:DUF295 domain-containing protein n=1 Tax=Brassica cretica TaxID=69181 RepID=A0A8S9SSA9_BRACR|nr:hypothetical protein F2Q69_00034938 [Brassica cretica]
MSFTSLVVHLFSLRLAPACLPSFFSNWHMTITSCLLALFLRLSCEKHMKGLEFLQLPGDRVLHDDAVSDCPYWTFDNEGDANSLVLVSLRDSLSKLVAHDSFMCAGDRIYFENLGSIIKEHRPCHFRLSTIGGVTPEVLLLIPRSYLDPVVMWEPGGYPINHEIVSGPGGHDQEVEQGPGGRLGTRRFLQNLRSYLGSGGRFEPRGCSEPEGRLGTRRFLLDPEVILNPKVSFGPRGRFKPGGCSGPGGRFEPGGPEIFSGHEECLGTRRFLITWGTVLRLPRQDYSRNLFGFHILLLGSWPLSSSYDVFYFCRKSLTGLEGAGVGVMTQVPGFAAFHVWRRRVLIAPCISQ